MGETATDHVMSVDFALLSTTRDSKTSLLGSLGVQNATSTTTTI